MMLDKQDEHKWGMLATNCQRLVFETMDLLIRSDLLILLIGLNGLKILVFEVYYSTIEFTSFSTFEQKTFD